MGRQNLNYQQGSGKVRLEAGKATRAPDTVLSTVESTTEVCQDSLHTAPSLDRGAELLITSLHGLLEGGLPWPSWWVQGAELVSAAKGRPRTEAMTVAAVR